MTEKIRVSASSVIRSVADTSATPTRSRPAGESEATAESVLFKPMLRRTFGVAAVGWACAPPLATWLASRPHPPSVPYAAAFGVYGIGAWICHQRPDRSFHLWAMQMPVCARCAGIYAGGAVAAMSAYVAVRFRRAGTTPLKPRRPSYARSVLMAAALPTLVTLIFEWVGGGTPSNAVRALAGLPIGAAIAWMVLRAEVN